MAGYITHIIPHDFKNFDDQSACDLYVSQVQNRIIEKLGLQNIKSTGYIELIEDACLPPAFRIEFDSPFGVTICLRKDFWEVHGMCKFDMFPFEETMKGLNIHAKVIRIAKAIGASEVWHALDFCTWDSPNYNILELSLAEWLYEVRQILGEEIPEYNYSDDSSEPIPLVSHEIIR